MSRNAAAVFLLVFVTRLPFLGPGFGADPDAWRIAGAARDIGTTGHYVASRFPGAPLVEIADSLLLPVGPWTLPLASAVWGAIGAAAFYLALCRLGARGCFWAALALGFTPVFWIHTTDAMDYAWALGLGLVGLALAVDGRPTLAGLAIGLAVGCRITSAAFLIPIGLLLAGPRPAYGKFLLAAVLAGALALAPSFLTYGTRFLSGYEFGRVPWVYVLKAVTRDVWGVIGSIAVATAVLFALTRVGRVPKRELAAVASALVLFGAIFLRLPHDGAYLLPVVPFVLLFVSRALPKAGVAMLACALAASSLVGNVVEDRITFTRPRLNPRAGHTVRPTFGGPLFTDRERRVYDLEARDRILGQAGRLPANAIVLVYERLPSVLWAVPTGSADSPQFVHLLDREMLARAKREGRPIAATDEAFDSEQRIYGVSPEELGATGIHTEPNSL